MSFSLLDVRDALEAFGQKEYDAAVSTALASLDNPMDIVYKDISTALRDANVPGPTMADVCGYLFTPDPAERAALVEKAKAKRAASATTAAAEVCVRACVCCDCVSV